MNESVLKRKAKKGVFWSFFERFSMQGVQFLTTVIMARILTPTDYGLIGMLAVFMSLSEIFIDGGFSSALIQKKDRNNVDFCTSFYVNLLISVIIYFLLFTSAPYIAGFYNQPILIPIIRVYSINLIIHALAAINRTILIIKVDFKTLTKISFVSAIISGTIGIICAYKGYGVWSLVILMISSSILNVILSFLYVKWIPCMIFSIESFSNLFSFGSKLLISNILNSVYVNVYNLVIGKWFSPQDLGFYTRADQFTHLISTNISNILGRVSFPVLSEIQDDNKKLLAVYGRYIELSSFIMFPLLLGLCGIATPLIEILLTEKWLPCAPLLQVLSIAYLGNGIIRINLNLLYVKGRSDLVLKLELIKKPMALLILFITMQFSVFYIAVGFALYSLIALYINTYYTQKLLDFPLVEQLKIAMPYFMSSVFVLLEALISTSLIENAYMSLLVSVTVGCVTYFFACKRMNLYAYRETVTQLINKRVKK